MGFGFPGELGQDLFRDLGTGEVKKKTLYNLFTRT
jgi:hypothetical protein